MKTKLTGIISLLCLLLTILWLAFFIASMVQAGTIDTYEKILAFVKADGLLRTISYINVILVTLSVVILFSLLYQIFKSDSPQLAAIGNTFVPIYGTLNLLVYLSQITVLPQLLKMQSIPEYQVAIPLLVRELIQIWPDSAVAMVNNLAYALLGIPSIVYGYLMLKYRGFLRTAGILLGLNGIACIIGFVGIVTQNTWVRQGSFVGGILFLLALFPLTIAFLKRNPVKIPA